MKKLFYAMSMLLTLALVWTGCSESEPEVIEKFTVAFDSQGGSEVSSMTVDKGTKITKPENPTKGTLIFADWYKEATCTNVWDFSSDVVTANITLYAKWTTVEYTVTFNTNGGSIVELVKVAEGGTFLSPLPPSKSNLAFVDWFKEAALTNAWNFNSDVVTANITLYAKWTDISSSSLRDLVTDSHKINSRNYTYESYNAMVDKRIVAEKDLNNTEGAPLEKIVADYHDLQAAIEALVALPVREVVDIALINSIVEGFIYVSEGSYIYLNAFAVNAKEEYATDSRVTFIYNEEELVAWTDETVVIEDNLLVFKAKSGLTSDKTIDITIKSAAKPTIYITVTLKIAAEGEMKVKFIVAVNALPEPVTISYDDYKAIDDAWNFYWMLHFEEMMDESVVAAHIKLDACGKMLEKLPSRVGYSFKGDVCTLTNSDFGQAESLETNFIANGAFPQGTYTTQIWQPAENGLYSQFRLKLSSGGKGSTEVRTSSNANGTGASAWEKDDDFSYTSKGSKATGGIIYLNYIELAQGNAANTANGTTRLFRR